MRLRNRDVEGSLAQQAVGVLLNDGCEPCCRHALGRDADLCCTGVYDVSRVLQDALTEIQHRLRIPIRQAYCTTDHSSGVWYGYSFAERAQDYGADCPVRLLGNVR